MPIDFTMDEINLMKRQLAVNAYNALIRMIQYRNSEVSTFGSARQDLGRYCLASGTTINSWSGLGVKGVYVNRAIEYAEVFDIPIFKHQLSPTNAIAKQWLRFEYYLLINGHEYEFSYWSKETLETVIYDKA